MKWKKSKNKRPDYKKQMRAYAKAHNIIILWFRKEEYSGDIYGVAIQERQRYDGVPLYSFGRLYHVFGNDFVFDQCGCYSSTDPMEVRKRAYSFFGRKIMTT